MRLRRLATPLLAAALVGVGLTSVAAPSSAGDLSFIELAQSPCSFSGSLTDFYTAPTAAITAAPGTMIRCQERTDIQGLTGATAYRVMYVSEAPAPGSYGKGTKKLSWNGPLVKRYSTGMIFIPTAAAPRTGGRKIVAWDHGTVGMGQTCAPSINGYDKIQAVTPTSKPNMTFGFVQNMINNNWIVTATDYAGLGIINQPDSLQYLVGPSEAMDTANAVRLAVAFPGSGAKSLLHKPEYAVYGQSQGGHAALWTGTVAPTYAPEITLTSVAASDPAANMVPLVQQQYNKLIGWVLGPEVVIAWPGVQPTLNVNNAVTPAGLKMYEKLADMCVLDAAKAAFARDPLGKNPFFTAAVTTDPGWVSMEKAQTPPVIKNIPVLIGQTQNDGVVLANTNASLQLSLIHI